MLACVCPGEGVREFVGKPSNAMAQPNINVNHYERCCRSVVQFVEFIPTLLDAN